MVYLYMQHSVQSDKSEHSIVIQSNTEGYTIFLETKGWGWNPKNKISQIYSPDKDCKFWAGLLLRNVVYLLSFIAPGYRLAITYGWSSPNSGNSRTFTVDIDFFIDLLISESADNAYLWKLAM